MLSSTGTRANTQLQDSSASVSSLPVSADSRWPVILTNIVSAISSVNHTLGEGEKDKLAEGKEIIRKLSELKHNMGRNGVLQ